MKTWILKNQFSDEITAISTGVDMKMKKHFSYRHYDSDTKEYINGHINKVKSYINKKRGVKSVWTEVYE